MEPLVVRLVSLALVGLADLAAIVLLVLLAPASHALGILEGVLTAGLLPVLSAVVAGIRDYDDTGA